MKAAGLFLCRIIPTFHYCDLVRHKEFKMKNTFEEQYVFYRLVSADLDEAYRSLEAIRRYKRGPTIMALIKNAIVSYARPFKRCNGRYGRYSISPRFVPKNHLELHKLLMHHRDRIIAHTDIDVREPKLVRWDFGSTVAYPIQLKGSGYYYEDYLALVDEMKELIQSVKNAVLEAKKEREKNL